MDVRFFCFDTGAIPLWPNPKTTKPIKPPEKQQPSDENQTEYREISKEALDQILEEPKKWAESDGKEGERADLRKV
jgi:hypothetical protein